MKKELIIIIAMIVATMQLTNAQVKNQYQDDVYAQTTVVVKEDSATDADILNNQFDLDEIGMGQVIRITTAPAEVENKVQKQEQLAEATPKKEPIRNSKKIVSKTKTQKAVAEQPAVTKKVAEKTTVKTRTASSKSTRTYSKKRSKKKKSFKLFNTKKKQKRKKYSKRQRSKCYRF